MKKLLSILALFLFVSTAQAGLHLEPFVGLKAFGSENAALYGSAAYGARVGYSQLGFAFGGEVTLMKDDNSNQNLTALAVFGSYDIPVLPFRVLGRYVADAGLDNINSALDKGTGYGIGLGFTMLPFVEIFLDYNMLSTDASIAYGPLTAAGTLDYKEIMLSVSLPFDL